jgi:hypothetical protein
MMFLRSVLWLVDVGSTPRGDGLDADARSRGGVNKNATPVFDAVCGGARHRELKEGLERVEELLVGLFDTHDDSPD